MTSVKRLQEELKFLKQQNKEVKETYDKITDPFEKMMASRMQKIYDESYQKTKTMLEERKAELKRQKNDRKI
jgi:hypothetical protein